jgi:hypothetical protein
MGEWLSHIGGRAAARRETVLLPDHGHVRKERRVSRRVHKLSKKLLPVFFVPERVARDHHVVATFEALVSVVEGHFGQHLAPLSARIIELQVREQRR